MRNVFEETHQAISHLELTCSVFQRHCDLFLVIRKQWSEYDHDSPLSLCFMVFDLIVCSFGFVLTFLKTLPRKRGHSEIIRLIKPKKINNESGVSQERLDLVVTE